MKQRFAALGLVLGLASPGWVHAGFPEIPFCPLGGPPGWFNTLFERDHQRRYYYPPPRYAAYPPPAWRPAPGYPPVIPASPPRWQPRP